MKVVALKAFVGLGLVVTKGQEIELPPGADWLQAGLVAVLPGQAPDPLPGVEHAVDPAVTQAEKRKRKTL